MFIALYKMTGSNYIEEIHSSYGIRLMEEHVDELFQVIYLKYFQNLSINLSIQRADSLKYSSPLI